MRLALTELWRRPGRFAVAGGALTLIVVLLLLLGGLLDGVTLGSTGLYRAQEGQVLVMSADARDSIIRSRLGPEIKDEIAGVDGVDEVYGLGVALVGARVADSDDFIDAAVTGFEGGMAGADEVPAAGEALADRSLASSGVSEGDTLEIGPERIPVTIVGWVDDVVYLQQGGVLVEPETWRQVLTTARPDAALGEGAFQVYSVLVDGDATEIAEAIDDATGGATSSLTIQAAIDSLPGVQEQESTFGQIIAVTFFVAGLVVALFFAFVTLERTPLYGVLKAMGTSSIQIYVGLIVQAVVVTTGALVLGGAIAYGLSLVVPPDIPLRFEPSRAAFVVVGMLVTAVAGGSIPLRRVIRIDPAAAIG